MRQPTTTVVTIETPGLISTVITVTAETVVEVAEQDVRGTRYVGLLVDGAFKPLVMWKHTIGRPEHLASIEAARQAIADAAAALAAPAPVASADDAQIVIWEQDIARLRRTVLRYSYSGETREEAEEGIARLERAIAERRAWLAAQAAPAPVASDTEALAQPAVNPFVCWYYEHDDYEIYDTRSGRHITTVYGRDAAQAEAAQLWLTELATAALAAQLADANAAQPAPTELPTTTTPMHAIATAVETYAPHAYAVLCRAITADWPPMPQFDRREAAHEAVGAVWAWLVLAAVAGLRPRRAERRAA